MAQHEAELKKIIGRTFGRRPDIFFWPNQTGVARSMDGRRVISYGLIGSGDILGVRQIVITEEMVGQKIGQAFSLELKSKKDTQSKQQKRFQAAFEKRGGLYVIVRSQGDLDCLDTST